MLTKREKMLFNKRVREKQEVRAQYLEDRARHQLKHKLRRRIRIST